MRIFSLSSVVIKSTQFLLLSLIAVSMVLSGCQPNDSVLSPQPQPKNEVSEASADVNTAHICDNATIKQAFDAQKSKHQVKGCGTIIKALPDDNEGSRHQKILVELTGVTPKQTLLLVHNIDIAQRVAEVERGQTLSFYGEYIYNDKGGLVHWTHHDPAARHQGGWIESGGVRYE